MQAAVAEPAFGLYGTWEAAHPECVEMGLGTNSQTRMIQLLFVRFSSASFLSHHYHGSQRKQVGFLSNLPSDMCVCVSRVVCVHQASICFCQVLFMASRAPRVTWEAVYLPFVETVLYGLSATGNGQMRLEDGRMVPIARFCSWLITCPIMLFQVVAIYEVKWWGVPTKNMVMAAGKEMPIFLDSSSLHLVVITLSYRFSFSSKLRLIFSVFAALIRTVFGIGASVCTTEVYRWAMYCLSCIFFAFELIVAYQIFDGGLKKFSAVKTPRNNNVYARLQFLRFIFFVSVSSKKCPRSFFVLIMEIVQLCAARQRHLKTQPIDASLGGQWNSFAIIWLLSSTGLCVISEDASVCKFKGLSPKLPF
eukprot:2539939-Rhodomonas_salina.1